MASSEAGGHDEHILGGRLLSSLRVVDLREELVTRGLSKSGAKKDLVHRLKTYLDQQSSPIATSTAESTPVEEPSTESPKAEPPPATPAAPPLTSPERPSAAPGALPQMKINAQLSDNDFVKDYLALRQSQFQSATANAALTQGASPPTVEPSASPDPAIASASTPAPASPAPPHVPVRATDAPSPTRSETVPAPAEASPTPPPAGAEKPTSPVVSLKTPSQASVPDREAKPPTASPKVPENNADPSVSTTLKATEPTVAAVATESPATPVTSAVPSHPTDELVPLRTMTATHKEKSEKSSKRNWGGRILNPVDEEKHPDEDDSPSDMSREISSQSLKDLVPNYKRLSDEEKEIQMDVMESDKVLEFEETSARKSPPAVVEQVSRQPAPIAPPESTTNDEPPPSKRPLIRSSASPERASIEGEPSQTPQSSVVFVANLVRPFTVNQLKALLARTGTFEGEQDFWIDKIKSKCYVRYAKHQEAKDTIAALNGVVWPSSNPKKLLVKLSSETQFNEVLQNGGPVGLASARPPVGSNTNPLPNLNLTRPLADAAQGTNGGGQSVKPVEAKPLDELFKKTKHHPCIYWKTTDVSKA
ncbi:apoptotic chromatin condensation inducer in the nucleus-like [Tigriopus californicus]|uniref:apoptotic chromatin condensation inducer in the nucleus-like n=1 Tax=Tigriopus californicus TaxID=6832 RepID=UPI0027DAAB09|nr:apoptotic chromatin condensation inducer in the nucleus-like [Tigriopus californicus]